MNILSQFNNFIEKNFNNYLKFYFSTNNYLSKTSSFSNYYNFVYDLDKFTSEFSTNLITSYFEYIDDAFFHSSYRKNFCSSKGFYERKNFVTLFGEINFKRRYYFDRNTKEHFFFVDLFLNLPKRKHFDPFVCAEIVDKSASTSYSKAGISTADKIGSRTTNTISISRATARNIVMAFNPIIDIEQEEKRIDRLFIMLDEKFVGSQFNNGKDHMIKAAVIFEDTKLEYKTKRKPNSIDRYRLINSHVCASINNDLVQNVVDYIYHNYDTEYLKEICFMGDCATWIKNFPQSSWFKFNRNLKNTFSMDGFHFSQALKHITTNQNLHWYNALYLAVKKNNINLFRTLCERFILENKQRESTIRSKMEYILNNWSERQLYQNHSYLKCSMESHISHIFADLFTSRPKAYSKLGLEKLLHIRLLKINGFNLKELYFYSILSSSSHSSTIIHKNQHFFDKKGLNLNFHSNNKYDIDFPLSINFNLLDNQI